MRPPAPRLGPRELPALRNAQPTGPPRLAPMVATSPLSDVTTAGQPLAPAVRRSMEAVLGVDLQAVRVHTGAAAQQAANNVNARAFTVGTHIYLGAGESAADLALLAHETTHAVQQSATLHASHPRGPPQLGGVLSAAPRGMIQREERAEDRGVLDTIADAASSVASTVADTVADGFWYAVDTFAPQEIVDLLHQIRDEGFLGMLRQRISSALDFVFSALRAQGGTMAEIANLFDALLGRIRPIMAALAAGDCEPLFAAVRSLGEMLGEMAGDVWNRITTFLTPIGEWMANVWRRFGGPVVDFLTEFAADTWAWIQDVGERLWNLTRPVRDFYSGAWTEIKNLLGFGEGGDSDGSGGLVGWITTQAGEIWDSIKTELRPVIEPIQRAADAIGEFLPLSAILHLRDRIMEWTERATAMADNMDAPDDLAENQDLLRDIILPGIRHAITSLRGKVTEAQTWVSEKIGGLVTKVTDFCGSLAANSLLSPFSGAIQWVSKEATVIGDFANNKVSDGFSLVDDALVTLDAWIEPIFHLLQRLVTALGDLMSHIGDLVLGPLLLVPRCIRDPIKDFIVERILRQIPVFSQLLALPDIWAQVQPACRAIVVQVFRDGDLLRAAWTFFRTVLRLLNVPPELVTNLIRNAARATREILSDPVGFLGNVLLAMKLGLTQFVDHLGTHLLDGAVNWLLSGVRGPRINIPDPFTINLHNVLDLVCQVLNLTMEVVFERIEARQGREVADRVRRMIAAGAVALEWLTILVRDGPAALWEHLRGQLNDLWDRLLNTVVDFLIGRIVQQATLWVARVAATGGLGVIIDALKAVYDALQVMAQYLRQMLEVANSVCEGLVDIAHGVLGRAADMVENAAVRVLPIMIAFLARTLGIGDLPDMIGEAIQGLRDRVVSAIDNLIDRTFRAIDWARSTARRAIDAVLNWWNAEEEIHADDGQRHHIYLEGERENPHLRVASDPMDGAAAIAAINQNTTLSAADKARYISQATAEKNEIEASVRRLQVLNPREAPGNSPEDEARKTQQIRDENSNLRAHLRTLATLLESSLFSSIPWTAIDDTHINPGFSASQSTTMAADPLTNKGTDGSEPENGTQQPKGWEELQDAGFTTGGLRYVQMHLINHRFGGQGKKNNLVPGSTQNNRDHLRSVENPIKDLVGNERNDQSKKGYMWYTATVHYRPAGEESRWPASFVSRRDGRNVQLRGRLTSADFAQSIQLTWGLYQRTNNAWQKQSAAVGSFTVAPIPLPPFETVV